jgi:hypothetical protein
MVLRSESEEGIQTPSRQVQLRFLYLSGLPLARCFSPADSCIFSEQEMPSETEANSWGCSVGQDDTGATLAVA